MYYKALYLFVFKSRTIANHSETVETRNETTLQKLGLNNISTEKEIISTKKEISRPRHLTRAACSWRVWHEKHANKTKQLVFFKARHS